MVRVVRNPFYLSDEQATATPSRHDNITETQEFIQRAYVVMATGQVFFHRFYHRCSLAKYNHVWMAAASLFLACKVEEQLRRLREVVSVVYYCFTKRETGIGKLLDIYGAQGYEWKMEVVKAERFLLKELGFHTGVEHPHKFILVYLNTLRSHSGIEAQDPQWKSFLQRSWNYANDMLRTDLCCRVPPEYIACGCIHLAAKDCEIPLPQERVQWWQVFEVNAEGIQLVENTAKRIYQMEKLAGQYVDWTRRETLMRIEQQRDRKDGHRDQDKKRRNNEENLTQSYYHHSSKRRSSSKKTYDR
ncbi:Cyclin-L1-1 [Galdieria sulphuraria]|nr:Cyclin-L1-1 [Galdieria sulphuraria]